MSNETTHKSEDQRITELEEKMQLFDARFDTLENQIARLSTPFSKRLPNGFPGIFMPILACSDETAKYEKGSSCSISVMTSMDGEFVYKTVDKTKACTSPKPSDIAKAANAAKANLILFGKTWCKTESNICDTGLDCKPALSGLRLTYKSSSRKKGDKKECVVTASLSGTVLCTCQSG